MYVQPTNYLILATVQTNKLTSNFLFLQWDNQSTCIWWSKLYKYTYIHTYIHTYTYNIHTYTHTHTHTYIHKYIHTYIHTYIYNYIHTYTDNDGQTDVFVYIINQKIHFCYRTICQNFGLFLTFFFLVYFNRVIHLSSGLILPLLWQERRYVSDN